MTLSKKEYEDLLNKLAKMSESEPWQKEPALLSKLADELVESYIYVLPFRKLK